MKLIYKLLFALMIVSLTAAGLAFLWHQFQLLETDYDRFMFSCFAVIALSFCGLFTCGIFIKDDQSVNRE